MKLTYIANIRFPTERAHGIQIMSMCEAFADAGADVTLLVSDRRTSIKDNPFTYYGVKNNFKIERLKTFDLTHWGHIFRAAAYHLERITFTRSAFRYTREHSDQIFYTRDELTFIRFTKFGIPVIFEMHTMPLKKHLYKNAFRNAQKIVAITSHLKQALIKNGVDSRKIIVAPDGVNLKSFENPGSKAEARQLLNLSPSAFIAMYIGLFDDWKGYKVLLAAASELKKNGVETVLVGGKNTELSKLKGQYPDAHIFPLRPYTELPLLQQAADVLVIPNSSKFDISRLYTSPLKLFAHMTSGIPMVVSDLPSLREIVGEKTAFFFESDNVVSLINAILRVKHDPNASKLLAEHAEHDVLQYSWERRARKILENI